MKQARTLSDKQIKSVLAHCSTRRHGARDRAIVAFSFYAGLRAKEIASLTINNITDAEGNIRNESILDKQQTKGDKARRIFVSDKLRKELIAYFRTTSL